MLDMHIKLTTKQSKKIGLDILVAFDKFCKEHNLKYYLVYGTLLGAVRHHGYIPWDDDVDVAMFREDYEKLNKLINKKISVREDLAWFSSRLGNWNEPLLKLVNLNTECYERGGSSVGVWIDVFVLDNYDKKIHDTNDFWRKVHIAKCTHYFDLSKKGIGKLIFKCLFFWKSLVRIAQEMDDRIKNISYTGKFSVLQWPDKDVNDISVYEPAAELSFEGHQFCVPGKYTDYLLNQYGSTYMELPPEKDRQTHGIEPYWIGTKEEFDKLGL